RSVDAAASSFAPFAEQRLTNTSSDHNISSHAAAESPQKKNALLKWKGIVFTPEEEEEEEEQQRESRFEDLFSAQEETTPQSQRSLIVTLELTRGWNSRLGFSLQNDGSDTVIVAIYADSVAARDGRLNVGDVILEVNENDVQGWSSESVIDVLRKTRGKILLKLRQKET
ncbi:UNVERIFIED_CONTAM: hypothetical protein GTU68_044791, partial [Idotea baltica]|nr:hypothetical protein [Idotea baltica]